MDYRLWFAAIGFASVLAMWGFHRFGRTKANEHLQARGVLVEGEVLKCNVQGSRFIWTEITFTYAPEGGQPPVTVTRKLDGRVLLEAGSVYRFATCVLIRRSRFWWDMKSVMMPVNKSIDTVPQQQEAAPPQVLVVRSFLR